VCVDLWRLFRGKVEQLTLTTRIILWTSFWLLLAGTVLIYLGEPSVRSMSPETGLMAAFFQAMTAMTTVGFNTVPIGSLAHASILLLIMLMVIGASPSGTGGGMKSTTVSALIGVMKSALRGRQEVRFWGRPVPTPRVWTAVASVGFYISLLLIGTYLLEITEPSDFAANIFEAASAIGTVGLSMGITASLSSLGKVFIVFLMFAGRLGPLTFGMALFFRKPGETGGGDSDLAV
jgi:trk system potassium uptake protein TrkH